MNLNEENSLIEKSLKISIISRQTTHALRKNECEKLTQFVYMFFFSKFSI